MAGFRTKYEPPGIGEALIAAEGLTADLEEQLELAAALMGTSVAEVRRWREQHGGSARARRWDKPGGARRTPEVVVIKRRTRAA